MEDMAQGCRTMIRVQDRDGSQGVRMEDVAQGCRTRIRMEGRDGGHGTRTQDKDKDAGQG